jgi:hypothetical protein
MATAYSHIQEPQAHSYGFNDDTFRANQPASMKKPPQPTQGLNAGTSFFKTPGQLAGSGTAAKIGPIATALYVVLWENGNRNGSNTFKSSDKALSLETGICLTTLREVRAKLVEERLIEVRRGSKGQRFTYYLVPQDWKWVKRAERPEKPAKQRKPRAPKTAPPTAPPATMIPAPTPAAPKIVTMPTPAPSTRPMRCRHCRCSKMTETETPGRYQCGVCYEFTMKPAAPHAAL